MTVEPSYTFQKPEGLLAHYTDAAAVFEHILPERRLRMSPYRRMRDPAENQDIVPGIAWTGEQPRVDDAFAGVYYYIKRVRDAMRVLSFTRDAADQLGSSWPAFDCCWARPRMWEQYGDDHRGACLLFARDRLERALEERLGKEKLLPGDVEYTRAGIAESATRSLVDERIFDGEQRERAVTEYIDNNRRDFFFLKSDDFETEAEYRVVLKTGDPTPVGYSIDDQGYAYVGYGDALVAVVVGLHFPPWQRPGARESCDVAGVRFLRMWWEAGSPVLLGTAQSSA
jgi:Protein of unknown function (DUF2971)